MKSSNTTAKLLLGASLAAMAVGALPAIASAQTQPAQGNVSASDATAVEDIIVVGARLAERSAIDRKKRAATAVDSIVADDVGQFPDKSIGEAVSRIAGVALDVSDSGESGGFTIRGQTADLIRVEVDGMTVLDNTTGQGGRNAQLNELSSDLIKSVDVIKGQTADMTPGGVGGTVRIEQRNGLDFSKPLVKLNLQAQKSNLNDAWSPRVNFVAAGKFLDGRLGLLFNGTYDLAETTQDFARISDKNAGYIPMGDWDGSDEKTFTQLYDPSAAAIMDQDDCDTLSDSTAGVANNARRNCYAQWEDWMPSLVRFGRGYREDEKISFQVRADFRVSDNLTVFASFNPNIREFRSYDYNLSVATPRGETDANGNMASVTNFRALNVNENHYVTEYEFVRTGSAQDVPNTTTDGPTIGTLNYSTQTRQIQKDQEQIMFQTGADFYWDKWSGKARAQYGTAKGERQDWAFTLQAPLDSAAFAMDPVSGVWSFDPVARGGLDLTDPAAYYAQVNTTTGVSPSVQHDYIPQADQSSELAYQLDMTRDFDAGEAGIFTRFKWGIQRRQFENETWREGGAFNLGNGVIQSRARSLDQIRVCTAPSLTAVPPATAPACTLGSVARPNRGVSDQLYKLHSLTPEQYNEIIDASVMDLPGGQFFHGVPDRGNMFDTWTVFDMDIFRDKLGQYADLSDWNLSCLYNCIADDGNTYKHNSYATKEITSSAYAMLDFEGELFGMDVIGNAGVRYQSIDVEAQTVLVVQDRDAVAFTDPDGSTGYRTQDTLVTSTEATIAKSSRDVLPSFNIALWPIEDQLAVRYSIAKQRARPSLSQLTGTSVVTCYNVDEAERDALEQFLAANPGAFDDADPSTDDSADGQNFITSYTDRCSGRIGNPSLKGYGALTQNLSLEWYPNRDTQISIAAFKIAVDTGRPRGVDDPAYVIDGNPYEVDTYEDGEGGLDTTGWEFSAKSAFTFLPGFLRHTGGGFNTSKVKSTGGTDGRAFDRLSGLLLPPRGESAFYHNINLWYDDGRINARVAYQTRDVYFQELNDEGANRVPGQSVLGVGELGEPYGGGTDNYFKVSNPAYRSKTNSLDARASYNLNEHIQFFVEGKNLLDDTQYKHTPHEYREISPETTYRWDNTYVGRRYYVGMSYTF